jgi:L-ribulose-5-phosphate 4-epimerase
MKIGEGIIKYQLDHTPAPPPAEETLVQIGAWRQVLVATKLLGQDPDRYDGYGFGNISTRVPPFDAPVKRRSFVITGTQTGAIPILSPEHFTIVTAYDPEANLLVSRGAVQPSSESLTHGSVYDQDGEIRWVMHVHSPEIWRQAEALGLPVTAPDVSYGSPEMAAEVERLFRETDVGARRIFAMGGHEDGIISFGKTAEDAARVLFEVLILAIKLDNAVEPQLS